MATAGFLIEHVKVSVTEPFALQLFVGCFGSKAVILQKMTKKQRLIYMPVCYGSLFPPLNKKNYKQGNL